MLHISPQNAQRLESIALPLGESFIGWELLQWLLHRIDDYGRYETFVSLQKYAGVLTSAWFTPIALLVGFLFLIWSQQIEIRRVFGTGSNKIIYAGDTADTRVRSVWIVPTLIMVPIVIVAAASVSIAWLQNYNPRPVVTLHLPTPPDIAYQKRSTTPRRIPLAGSRIAQHTYGPNSPNVIGSGNQLTYSSEPISRVLIEEQARRFKHDLASARPAPFWLIIETNIHQHPGREMADEQGQFANQLARLLSELGWEDREDKCDKAEPSCPQPNIGLKYFDVIHH